MAFLRKNVDLGPALRLSPWRKIAIGTWKTAADPSAYGVLHVKVEPALAYLQDLQKENPTRMTISHFIGKALAETLKRHPEINSILRLGRIYPRKSIDIFYQVATDTEGQDLTGMKIKKVDQKSIPQIAQEMNNQVQLIREKKDPAFSKMKKNLKYLPGFLTTWINRSISFFMYGLNLWSSLFALPRDPFGSAMITNIGSLGIEVAFAPLMPLSRIPLIVTMGCIKNEPIAEKDQIRIAKMIKLCVTVDHRLIDGMYASLMVNTLNKIFENPRKELE